MLYHRNISPTLLCKGSRILNLTIDKHNITFIDSYKFIRASLSKCAKLFNLKSISKGDFPIRANSENFYNTHSIPAFHWFLKDNESPGDRARKMSWWKIRKKSAWHFNVEISNYCEIDVMIVIHMVLKFSYEWSQLQMELCNYFENKSLTRPFMPFGSPFTTLGSFTFSLYKYFQGNDYDIR